MRVLEERHPEQVLVIAQAAATVLDVRLLHERRVAILGAAFGLIFQAGGDVFVFVTLHALRDDRFLELGEELLIARDQTGFNQRGARFDAARVIAVVRRFHTLADTAHGMAGFEAEIKQRQPDAVQHPLQNRQGLHAVGHLTFLQKQEIDVAQRIQFAAAVTAERDQRDGGEAVLGALGEVVVGRVPKRPDHAVDHHRPHLANFQTAAPVLVREFQAMRRLFDEEAKAR